MADVPSRAIPETAFAKLNLFLDVVGRRADGFHELVTVFHEVGLADDVNVMRSPAPAGTIGLDILGEQSAGVPEDETNLASRAAKALLARHGRDDAVWIHLQKRIPHGAGLGGGSADAAATLRAVDALLGLKSSRSVLEEVGASLGSDVPFFVRGGTAVGRGRGERLAEAPARPLLWLLLVPQFSLSTAAVYAALPKELAPPMDPEPVLRALAAGDAAWLGSACRNALFPAACAVDARVEDFFEGARAAYGPRVHMTGSGSAFFVPMRPGEKPRDEVPIPHLAWTKQVWSARRGTAP